VVAFSGGPDSTALLAAIAASGTARPRAAYVDHGIRPAAERAAELALVKRSCARFHIPLAVARIKPGAVEELAHSRGIGMEAAAREYRKRALAAIAGRMGASVVLLAHTADDQAETLLMRLFGGAGSAGLRGMSPTSGIFLRPFLRVPKSALLAYLEERGIESSRDSTNDSERYLRNKIRLRLVPFLDGLLPGWRRGLALTAERARLEDAALSAASAGMAFERGSDGRFVGDADAIIAAPEAVGLRIILDAAGLLVPGRFPFRTARTALAIARSAERAGYRGRGIELAREGSRLLLGRGLDFPRDGGYFVAMDRPCRIRAGCLVVSAAWTTGRGFSGIREDAFRFPIVVRSRRPGDSIAIAGGRKNVDELLAEWGLPAERRGSVPVVEDRQGIVAVLGGAHGGQAGAKDRYRLGPGGPGGRRLAVIVKGA
jgi:tRNA(Ile)-lysidine synthetase-like protein